MEVMDLKVEVKTAQLQSAALREEARLSSNVRLKLKPVSYTHLTLPTILRV